ncbi:class I SAM-dependent methyltransferase [Flammeovirgaceae bacterium]
MKMDTYEESYKESKHFSFGKNWKNFIKSLNAEKIKEAEKSILEFLGGEGNESICGKTFVDIGCGSGLFSLAAYRLGAKSVVSVDIDESSLFCVKHLKEKAGNPPNWNIQSGSVLDGRFIKALGQFDIVYSWGVLHHTGNMYKALEHVQHLVNNGGLLYLALYNRHMIRFRGGTSKFWSKIKETYNHSGAMMKQLFNVSFMAYGILGMIIRGRNPYKAIREYRSNRGMTWYNDRIDWLGGYPYEYASVEEIVSYYGARGFLCKNIKARDGIGCNEFLFVNSKECVYDVKSE